MMKQKREKMRVSKGKEKERKMYKVTGRKKK
jgi:hypothetical protein